MAAREALALRQELIQVAAPACRVLPLRSPCALAASRTRSIRPRRREPVSDLLRQSGLKTDSTSSVVISPTGNRRIGAAYFCNVISHWAACLELRHDGRMASISRSAQSPKAKWALLGENRSGRI